MSEAIGDEPPREEPTRVGATFDNELLAMAEISQAMDLALQRSRPKGSQKRIADWFQAKYGQ